MRINEAIQAVRNATSEDYMTRTCAVDDTDWMNVAFTLEHSLTAELNAAKNDHERYKTLEAENERLKDIYKGPHHSAIDATVCSDLVLREAERTYRVIDATRDALEGVNMTSPELKEKGDG